ncbi:hypothetical protein AB5I41_26735 [Sphingomonas sp. MMS24-JH45]
MRGTGWSRARWYCSPARRGGRSRAITGDDAPRPRAATRCVPRRAAAHRPGRAGGDAAPRHDAAGRGGADHRQRHRQRGADGAAAGTRHPRRAGAGARLRGAGGVAGGADDRGADRSDGDDARRGARRRTLVPRAGGGGGRRLRSSPMRPTPRWSGSSGWSRN